MGIDKYVYRAPAVRKYFCALILNIVIYIPDSLLYCDILTKQTKLYILAERVAEYTPHESNPGDPIFAELDQFLLQRLWWPHVLLLGDRYPNWEGLY